MSTLHYRLIFNGTAPGADFKKLLPYLQTGLHLSQERIQVIMTSTPPRVLKEFSTNQSCELAQSSLSKMGCNTRMEAILNYPYVPFALTETHDKLIRRELSKVLRCRSSMVILLINVGDPASVWKIPSLMGLVEDQLIEAFRDSDTVVAIDDTRLLVLGFATDKYGIHSFLGKVKRIIQNLLGQNIALNVGHALFPDEGHALEKLLQLAAIPREEEGAHPDPDSEPETRTIKEDGLDQAKEGKRERVAGITPLQLCFSMARGRIFKRLLNMDLQDLWTGISQISPQVQKEFLVRMPFDSPLAPALEEMIHSHVETTTNQAWEMRFNAIIHQMELEPGIARRNELYGKLQSKLGHTEDLPTLPSVATQIFKIASNPLSSGSEVANIIMRDPALTSKLLKTVNSAFYGNAQKISSVNHAVVFLGMDEVTDIAFGLAASKVFDVKAHDGMIDPKSLWHHSISTALIAQHLSRMIPQFQDSGIFTAGLLHDIGKIFMIEKFPDFYRETCTNSVKFDFPLFEMEEEHFGLNHATAGQYLTQRWNLPEELVQAITYHHQPFNATSNPNLAALTGLADYLYYRVAGSENPVQKETGYTRGWLSVGHWTFLTRLFKEMDMKKMDELTRAAATLIEEDKDYLDLIA